jgi:hypothetical protein
MKTLDDINLDTWFVDRELSAAPDHFVNTTAPMTAEAKEWILEKLHGRFAVSPLSGFLEVSPAFEDPKEAVFYELTWG